MLGFIKYSIMKFINVIALIVLCCLNSLNAQDTIQRIKIYRTWISLNSEPFNIKGVLYEIKDSSILVSSSVKINDYSTNKFEIVKLNITNIETIRTRRNNNIGRGILIGTITGFAVGSLIGFISGDDPPCDGGWYCFSLSAGEKALGLGFPLAVVGSVIGASIGSIKVRIPINGSIDSYNSSKNKLRKHSIKKK
jgi:hypothetical protein